MRCSIPVSPVTLSKFFDAKRPNEPGPNHALEKAHGHILSVRLLEGIAWILNWFTPSRRTAIELIIAIAVLVASCELVPIVTTESFRQLNRTWTNKRAGLNAD